MTSNDVNNWIMYHYIHRLFRLGFKKARIARYIEADVRTVGKYLDMSEEEYEKHLLGQQDRKKTLSPYEDFVKGELERYEDTSAAQVHDRLKENFADLPEVSPRTVYNFVMYVRQKHNIPLIRPLREYFPIEQCPYGHQAQLDFGEYNMRTPQGKRKKVWFLVMVLSRSRMKYLWFVDRPFTADLVREGHERTFAFFGGIPEVIVYDQDRTMVVDENHGDIILTAVFRQYVRSRSFEMHFCRKADPESKGKVENAVQYVKKNFLYNRPYVDIDGLNTEGEAWLSRTANFLDHHSTKRSPRSEFIEEQRHLRPYTPMTLKKRTEKTYTVRKTNMISYKSNFYSVPMGTYDGSGTQVIVREQEGNIEVLDTSNNPLCAHKLHQGKGKEVVNNHHRRDTSSSVDEMMDKALGYFTDRKMAGKYLTAIKGKMPRYIRDQLQLIISTLEEASDKEVADRALRFCVKNKDHSGREFQEIFEVFFQEATMEKDDKHIAPIAPLHHDGLEEKAGETPRKSDMDDHQRLFEDKK